MLFNLVTLSLIQRKNNMSDDALSSLMSVLDAHQFKLNFVMPDYTSDQKVCAMFSTPEKQFTTVCHLLPASHGVDTSLTDIIRATFADFNVPEYWDPAYTPKPEKRQSFIDAFGLEVYQDIEGILHAQ